MVKNIWSRMLSVMLSAVLICTLVPAVALADDSLSTQASGDTLSLTGTAYYDYAHQVLDIVNEERTNAGVDTLTLDVDLTNVAMQRAAELTVYYGHTRPNGEICFTATSDYGCFSLGENIAIGQTTPAQVMQGWFYDERDLYNSGEKDTSKVGHYLNIINPDFKTIGIGCFAQDVFCWEQMFSSSAGSGPVADEAVSQSFDVDVNYSFCGTERFFDMPGWSSYELPDVLNVGDTYQLTYCVRNDGWSYVYGSIDASCATWTSSNSSVVSVDSFGQVIAESAGTATVTATLPSGMSISQEWSVTQPISDATVESIPDQTYTGSAIEPHPAVTLGDKNLVEGPDYELVWSGNTNAGTATVTITGKGNYAGSTSATFSIAQASIADADVTLSSNSYTYDGTAHEPDVIVSLNGKQLIRGTDYIVTYSDNVNAGTAIVTVTGCGNYTGSTTASFTIVEAAIDQPGDDPFTPGEQPGEEPGDQPGEEPGGDQPGEEPGDNPTGDQPGDEPTGEEPGNDPSSEQPSNDPTSEEPGADPSGEQPGDNTGDQTDTQTPEPAITTQTMYRLYNPNSGEHFYTANAGEKNHLVSLGWSDEGTGWIAPTSGDPVYRLYNPNAGEHHYTLSAGERDMLVSVGWQYEGIGWYSGGDVRLYREYNPNAYANNHNYTTNKDEHDWLLSLGWKDEGYAWNAVAVG